MGEHVICEEKELAPGDRMLVQLEGREVAVFNLDGEYHAMVNWCPHQGGPACEGLISGTSEASFDPDTLQVELEWSEEEVIMNCPWHGWEFDITTGECLSRPPVKLPKYPVEIRDGDLVVSV